MSSVLNVLTDEEREKILKISTERSYSEGETIVLENTPGEEFYIIESGRVIVTKKIEEKEEKTLAILGEGDFFGEMSLLDGGPHSADVRALENVKVQAIKLKLFNNMLRTDFETASRFLSTVIKVMSERLRATSEELIALYEVGKIIGSTLELKELLSQVLSNVLMGVTKSSSGAFFLLNKYTGELEIKESIRIKEIDKELAQKLLKESLGTIINDIEQLPEFKGKIHSDTEILSFISSPITLKDKIIGLVLLGKEFKDGFKRGDLNLLIGVANQIVTAIENACFAEEEQALKKLRQVHIRY